MPDPVLDLVAVADAAVDAPVLTFAVDVTPLSADVANAPMAPGAEIESASASGDEASGDEPAPAKEEEVSFDFQALLFHHNLPYPAWEIVHYQPIIVFDLGAYTAKNLYHFAEMEPQGEVPEAYREWASSIAEKKGVDAGQLAIAMQVVDENAGMVFPKFLSWVNTQTFFGTIAIILMTLFVGVIARRRKDQLVPKNKRQHLVEAIATFIRNDVVRPNIHHGDAWTAHFVAIFLAVASFNLMGLIPGTATASGNIMVTAGFALMTLLTMLIFGMKEQGVGSYWKNLVPVPFTLHPGGFALWLILAVIELMGLLIKPTALAIRLFANMFAGHTVLLAFVALFAIIFSATGSSAMSAGLGAFGFVIALAIYALEVFVALLQAYVFTLLSAVFIGASLHPEH